MRIKKQSIVQSDRKAEQIHHFGCNYVWCNKKGGIHLNIKFKNNSESDLLDRKFNPLVNLFSENKCQHDINRYRIKNKYIKVEQRYLMYTAENNFFYCT